MQLQKCYVTFLYIWRDSDNTGFKIKHTVHTISGSALSSLKNSCCAPMFQLIYKVWYYHSYVNQGPDQQASLRQQCQAVHYDQCSGLLIFHTHLSTDRVPNQAAQTAVRNLITCGMDLNRITRNHQLTGHRNVGATACPGNAFFNVIRTWPNFTATPRIAPGEPLTYIPMEDESIIDATV